MCYYMQCANRVCKHMTHTVAEQRVVFLQEQVTLKTSVCIIDKLLASQTNHPSLKFPHHALRSKLSYIVFTTNQLMQRFLSVCSINRVTNFNQVSLSPQQSQNMTTLQTQSSQGAEKSLKGCHCLLPCCHTHTHTNKPTLQAMPASELLL